MRDLRLVPGIGAKKENDLFQPGYHSLEELKDADPDKLYAEDCRRKGYQEESGSFIKLYRVLLKSMVSPNSV